MSFKFKDDQQRNHAFREVLKQDWTKLASENTDKGRGLPKPSTCKTYPDKEIFALDPDINTLSMRSLYEVVHSRRSTRKYQDVLMTPKELSYLCNLTCTITKYGPGYAMGVIPSGGATSTLETYLYLNKVEGFKPGLYHYRKDISQLSLIRDDVTPEMVDASTLNQLRGAQVIFYWTATPYRSEYKYSFTAHKMIAQESGHACQNPYLASEAIGYGTVAIAAYNQIEADKLLQLDEDEFVIYVAAVGKKII